MNGKNCYILIDDLKLESAEMCTSAVTPSSGDSLHSSRPKVNKFFPVSLHCSNVCCINNNQSPVKPYTTTDA